MSESTFSSQGYLESKGLRVTHSCEAAWPSGVAVHWPERECFMCGETVIKHTPELAEEYEAWCNTTDASFVDKVSDWQLISGVGDWESFEMFQLHPNDPLRKEVNSMSEYKSACKARHLDPDTHKPTADNPKFAIKDNNSWE